MLCVCMVDWVIWNVTLSSVSTHTHARACARAHTHTHTHTFVYTNCNMYVLVLYLGFRDYISLVDYFKVFHSHCVLQSRTGLFHAHAGYTKAPTFKGRMSLRVHSTWKKERKKYMIKSVHCIEYCAKQGHIEATRGHGLKNFFGWGMEKKRRNGMKMKSRWKCWLTHRTMLGWFHYRSMLTSKAEMTPRKEERYLVTVIIF